jgi:hypothetical protein
LALPRCRVCPRNPVGRVEARARPGSATWSGPRPPGCGGGPAGTGPPRPGLTGLGRADGKQQDAHRRAEPEHGGQQTSTRIRLPGFGRPRRRCESRPPACRRYGSTVIRLRGPAGGTGELAVRYPTRASRGVLPSTASVPPKRTVKPSAPAARDLVTVTR